MGDKGQMYFTGFSRFTNTKSVSVGDSRS